VDRRLRFRKSIPTIKKASKVPAMHPTMMPASLPPDNDVAEVDEAGVGVEDTSEDAVWCSVTVETVVVSLAEDKPELDGAPDVDAVHV
jgi:hypothetical protein